jgi:hypothetical protein
MRITNRTKELVLASSAIGVVTGIVFILALGLPFRSLDEGDFNNPRFKPSAQARLEGGLVRYAPDEADSLSAAASADNTNAIEHDLQELDKRLSTEPDFSRTDFLLKGL